MKRKEFKQRLKGLLACMLVMILVVNGTQGGIVTAYADGSEESMIHVPLNYYGVLCRDDDMMDYIDIKNETAAEEGDAYFISSDYTTDVAVEADAAVIPGIVLPGVKKDGYFFMNWDLEMNGNYDEETQEVTLESGWTAGDLEEEGLSFVAYFEKALTSVINYDLNGGMADGKTDSYNYTITQPDIDTKVFEEPVVTWVPLKDKMIFNGWLMAVSYQSWYDEENGIIHGVYGESAELVADWREECIITVNYMVQDENSDFGKLSSDMVSVTFCESETAEPVIMLPEAIPFEGYAFAGWSCEDKNMGEYLVDLPGFDEKLDGYPAGTVFKPEYNVNESTGKVEQVYNLYARFTTAEYLKVLYDVNGGQGLENTEEIIYEKDVLETRATFILPAAPVHDTYTFTGWLSSVDGKLYEAGTEVSYPFEVGNVNFVAQWEVEIPITYNTVGGKITSTDHALNITIPTDATSVDDVVLPIVEKENAFFLNWELGIGSGGIYDAGVQDISWDVAAPAGSLTELPFTAIWQEALVSSITYEFTGAVLNGFADSYSTSVTQPMMDSKTFEEKVIGFEPVKKGFIFTGWELQVTDTGSGSYDTTDSGAVVSGNYGENYTLVAQWRPENTITITTTFAEGFTDAGTINGGTVGTYGESTESDGAGKLVVTLPDIKDVKEDYIFVGWKCYDANGVEVIVDGYVDISDYDGTVISVYKEGTTLLIAYPTDEKNVGGNTGVYVLEAQFVNAKAIEIAYDLNGGTGITNLMDKVYQSRLEEKMGIIVLPESVPIRAGYDFLGWLYSKDNKIYEAGSSIACGFTEQNVKLTAQWNEKVYKIPLIYNTDGGKITSEDYTVNVNLMENDTGTKVMLPEVEKERYFFTGWILKNHADMVYEAGEQFLTWTIPVYALDNLELTANWVEIKKSTVTYNLNGGNIDGSTVALTQEYIQPSIKEEMFSESVVKEVPVRKDYIFTGWSFSSTDGSSYERGVLKGHYGTDYVLTATWKNVIEAGTVTLKTGERYKLAKGNWMVNGDTTVYVGGGYFCVSKDGEYTFTEK